MQFEIDVLLIIRKMKCLRKINRRQANRKGNIFTPIVQVMNLSLMNMAMEKIVKKLGSTFFKICPY